MCFLEFRHIIYLVVDYDPDVCHGIVGGGFREGKC